jgi:RNA polymerase sigma-70 factor (ECF subfamily)
LLRKKEILKLSDANLLYQYKDSGKSIYVVELFDRYIPLLYGVGLKYLKDGDKAQDTVIRFIEAIRDKIFDRDSVDFRSWIYQEMKNFCLQIRSNEGGKEILIEDDSDFTDYGDIMYLLEKEDNYNNVKILKICLEKLPDQQRICLIYFFMNDLSFDEIADKTGYTLEHVKTYIRQGKRNLKISIEKNGL